MYATARAHRAVTSFRPTSTIRLAPVSSKWESCDIAVVAARVFPLRLQHYSPAHVRRQPTPDRPNPVGSSKPMARCRNRRKVRIRGITSKLKARQKRLGRPGRREARPRLRSVLFGDRKRNWAKPLRGPVRMRHVRSACLIGLAITSLVAVGTLPF